MNHEQTTESKVIGIHALEAKTIEALETAQQLARDIKDRIARGVVPFIPAEAVKIAELLMTCSLDAQNGRFESRLWRAGWGAEHAGRKDRLAGVPRDANPWDYGLKTFPEYDPLPESWEQGWDEQDKVERLKAQLANLNREIDVLKALNQPRVEFLCHPYKESQETISAWAQETFGPAGSNGVVAARANREMGELLSGLAANDLDPGAVEECADIVIVLMRLVDRMGGNLMAEIDRKMAINRKRRWIMRGDGTADHYGKGSQHVEEGR